MRKTKLNYFQDFPETEDEVVKEWVKNVSPFLNQQCTIASNVADEILRREKLMHDMKDDVRGWSPYWVAMLDLLKELVDVVK